jgi:hypothetical protein
MMLIRSHRPTPSDSFVDPLRRRVKGFSSPGICVTSTMSFRTRPGSGLSARPLRAFTQVRPRIMSARSGRADNPDKAEGGREGPVSAFLRLGGSSVPTTPGPEPPEAFSACLGAWRFKHFSLHSPFQCAAQVLWGYLTPTLCSGLPRTVGGGAAPPSQAPLRSSVRTALATALRVSKTPSPVVAAASKSGTLVGLSSSRS